MTTFSPHVMDNQLIHYSETLSVTPQISAVIDTTKKGKNDNQLNFNKNANIS